ncbi:hypothetical protein [Glycomyces albidus]|uniref:Uncharacterized protein n=1 Tax=Glycomyces albidus TaxID=2656774 RepID=A0A6L5G9I8_9ACTN|nr:hypothetical protein [Glycomyces albidus]MQM26369.1 hypothetical protein [Glycomyces albidus]
MSRTAATVLAAAILSLASAACSAGEPTQDGGDESPAAVSEALVDWAEAFCAAPEAIPTDLYIPFTAAARGAEVTEDDRRPLIDALAEVDRVLADAVAAVDAVPAGPTPEAEAALEQYRADVEEARSGFAEYADLAPVYPVEQLEDLYLLAGMDAMNLPYPLMMAETYLTAADLNEAAQKAPACGGAAD